MSIRSNSSTPHGGHHARRRVLRRAGAMSMVLVAAVVAGSATWLFTHGWSVAVIETGSMAPAYPEGSLLLVDRADPDEVRVGDVVGYEDDAGRLVSHRVTAISRAVTGERLFTTRGDANPVEDPMPVADRQLRGRVVAGLPHLGSLAQVVLGPFVAGAVLLVGVVLVASGRARPPTPLLARSPINEQGAPT